MPQGLSLSTFKAALFDVDGTLVDSMSFVIRGLGETYERFLGFRPSDSEIRSMVGTPLSNQLKLLKAETSPQKLSEMTDFAVDYFANHHHEERIFEESVETLRMCRRAGIRTALVTSKNAIELEQFLDRFIATNAIDATVCASDVHHPKPDPESAILACRRLQVEPSQAVMIGDSVFDLRSARDAGVTAIAVGFGAADRATLLAESPSAYFETPRDLLDWAQQSLLETSCQERKQTI
jgi:pyrophosphatase PpaX